MSAYNPLSDKVMSPASRMTEHKAPEKKLTTSEKLDLVTTVIFTPEVGHRMKVARMELGLDQAQLGEKLGVSQQIISRLERGVMKTSENPCTLAQFKEVFGRRYTYVLIGTGSEATFEGKIRVKYWKNRNKRPKRTQKESKGKQ